MLTARQIDGFKRDGVIVLRGFYSGEEVRAWREQVRDYFGRPASGQAWRDALAARKPDDFRLSPDPTPRDHPRLAALYRELHATADWAGHNQLIVRAGDDPAEWRGPRLAHVDIPVYAPLRTLANNVLYLSTVRERGGGFVYWPGSHRVAWDYFAEFPEDYLATGERTHNQTFERLLERTGTEPVEFTGGPGDLLVWHALTLHSATINKRSEERIALFGRWGVVLGPGEDHDFGGDMWRHWRLQEAAPAFAK